MLQKELIGTFVHVVLVIKSIMKSRFECYLLGIEERYCVASTLNSQIESFSRSGKREVGEFVRSSQHIDGRRYIY